MQSLDLLKLQCMYIFQINPRADVRKSKSFKRRLPGTLGRNPCGLVNKQNLNERHHSNYTVMFWTVLSPKKRRETEKQRRPSGQIQCYQVHRDHSAAYGICVWAQGHSLFLKEKVLLFRDIFYGSSALLCLVLVLFGVFPCLFFFLQRFCLSWRNIR